MDMESQRGELAEAGWTHVPDMTDAQVSLIYEAEGDRNHEQVSGERKLWEHQWEEEGRGERVECPDDEADKYLLALHRIAAATEGSAADLAEVVYGRLEALGIAYDSHGAR